MWASVLEASSLGPIAKAIAYVSGTVHWFRELSVLSIRTLELGHTYSTRVTLHW